MDACGILKEAASLSAFLCTRGFGLDLGSAAAAFGSKSKAATKMWRRRTFGDWSEGLASPIMGSDASVFLASWSILFCFLSFLQAFMFLLASLVSQRFSLALVSKTFDNASIDRRSNFLLSIISLIQPTTRASPGREKKIKTKTTQSVNRLML